VLSSKPRALISWIGMSLPGPWSRPLVTRIQSRMQGTSWIALKQIGSVEDFANKFQSLVAEIVAMPPSEGDLLQKFRNGLKPDIQMVASVDPVTGTRWMNLQKFITFACAIDASTAQANKSKAGLEKQMTEQKAKDWEHNSCFICHKEGHMAKECPDRPKNTRVDFAKTK
jgi:hypothetical protein